jgi:hypothetical protein
MYEIAHSEKMSSKPFIEEINNKVKANRNHLHLERICDIVFHLLIIRGPIALQRWSFALKRHFTLSSIKILWSFIYWLEIKLVKQVLSKMVTRFHEFESSRVRTLLLLIMLTYNWCHCFWSITVALIKDVWIHHVTTLAIRYSGLLFNELWYSNIFSTSLRDS